MRVRQVIMGGLAGGVGALWLLGLQPSPAGQARTTAQAFDGAVARRDWATGCEMLAARSRASLGNPSSMQCHRLLAARGLRAIGAVHRVTVNGGWAEVRQSRGATFLVWENGDWRVEAASCPRPGMNAPPPGCRLG